MMLRNSPKADRHEMVWGRSEHLPDMMRRDRWSGLPFGAVSIVATLLAAAATAEPARIKNGITGIVDMPSAFHQDDAETSAILSFDDDVRTLALAFQALPRLETSLSFSDFASGAGPALDDNTALNFKVLLLREGTYRPAVSLGVDDLFANTRESAEYIVASKRFGDTFRVSAGLGWGHLGGYATAADIFADRPQPSAPGRATFSHLFQGNAALFGGVEWDTPLDGLTLAAEYSSAAGYGAEGPDSRFNFAAKYRVADALDLVAYHRGGTTTGVTLSFHANAKSPPARPDLGDLPPLTQPRPAAGRDIVGWAEVDAANTALRQAAAEALAGSAIRLERFATAGRVIRVGVSARDNSPAPKIVGRTVRVLSALAPPSVETFEITTFHGGLPGATFTVPRDEVVALAEVPGRGRQAFELVTVEGASPADDAWSWSAPPPRGLSWNLAPAVSLPLDASGDIDAEISLFANARYDISRSFYLGGTVSYLVAGDREITPPPATPAPRSDGSSYDRRAPRLDRLYGAYSTKLNRTLYGGLTFGLLEREYAGLSAEALFLPDNAGWALGAELTHAIKRDYDNPFGLLDFEATTGFLSLYWDTGYEGLEARVDAGRYLAGDWGATLTLTRSFPNGWEVSGYTTLTEDNRDEALKLGATVSIPLATFGQLETRRRSTLRVGGNYGDAGARVDVPDRLMSRVKDARAQRIEDAWSEFWN